MEEYLELGRYYDVIREDDHDYFLDINNIKILAPKVAFDIIDIGVKYGLR